MTITVFGATGMVGKELVRLALDRGHHVRAFGRNVFTAGFPDSEKLELIKGALFDETEVLSALEGADAVFSAIGGSLDGKDRARSLGMENIVRQMKKAGVRHILAVGGMGVLDDKEGNVLLHKPGYPARFLAVGEEHLKACRTLQQSDLEWTFIGCPDILPGNPSGSYHTEAETTPDPNSYRILAADLALFMMGELEQGKYLRKRVGICN